MDSLLVGFSTGTQGHRLGQRPARRPAAGGVADPPVLRRDGRPGVPAAAGRAVGAYEWWRHRRLPPQRLFWLLGAVSGLAAIVAMECGWVVTEVGRQPWVVYQLQTTAAAATTNGGVIASLSIVIALYAVLGAATILILRMLARRWRRGDAGSPLFPTARRRRCRTGRWAGPGRDRGRGRRGHPAGHGHPVRRPGRGRLRRRPVGPAGRRRPARARAAAADRRVDHAGMGGQPRLARLRPGHLLDRVPARVRRGDDGGRAAAVARRCSGSCCAAPASPSARRSAGLGLQRGLGATFAFSSLLTPFFMGTVIGAIATGQIPADASHASLPAWTSATSLLTGFVFVGACGYLAAVYLVGEAARRGDRRLQRYFTRRAQAAGHRDRGAVAGHPGRTAQLESGTVQPPHRAGAAAGDHRRAVRPGRPGPADRMPAARHPGPRRARASPP